MEDLEGDGLEQVLNVLVDVQAHGHALHRAAGADTPHHVVMQACQGRPDDDRVVQDQDAASRPVPVVRDLQEPVRHDHAAPEGLHPRLQQELVEAGQAPRSQHDDIDLARVDLTLSPLEHLDDAAAQFAVFDAGQGPLRRTHVACVHDPAPRLKRSSASASQ